MKLRWKTLFVQVVVWAVSEVALTCAGMDDLADYSEFILDRKQALIEAISVQQNFFGTAEFTPLGIVSLSIDVSQVLA